MAMTAKEKQDAAKAKAWANYIKVRDAERAKLKQINDKHGHAASGWGKGFSDADEIKKKIKQEIEAKHATAMAAAKVRDDKKQAAAKAIIDAARQACESKVAAAWQAFEVLDIGGRTKKP